MSTMTKDRRDMVSRICRLEPSLRALGVKRLAVFGSFVRGTQNSASDIDLLVDFQPGRKTFDNFVAVCELLEESLQRRVELLTTESLSPHLGPRILQEAVDVIVAD